MLKVTASQMKVSTKPSKATVQAMPAGHTELVRRGAEADARAREYKAGAAERRAEVMAGLAAFNRARYAATKDEREAYKAAREAERREEAKNRPKLLWDNHEEVAFIQKSRALSFHISACTRNGYRYVTIRECYKSREDGLWRPGKNGLSIPLMMPLNRTKTPDPNTPIKIIHPMQEFVLAIQQAFEIASTMELADPENEVWVYPKNKSEEKQDENR